MMRKISTTNGPLIENGKKIGMFNLCVRKKWCVEWMFFSLDNTIVLSTVIPWQCLLIVLKSDH